MTKAKVFWCGRSQAVRLPKAFRCETDEVRIRRHGRAVILEPVATDWAWLDALVGPPAGRTGAPSAGLLRVVYPLDANAVIGLLGGKDDAPEARVRACPCPTVSGTLD